MAIIFNSTNPVDDATWQGYHLRAVIPLANLTNPGFTTGQIRVTFELASTASAANCDSAFIGAGIASPVYDFDGSQVQLLFGGSPSNTGLGSGAIFTSDFVPFTFNFSTAVSLVIATHWSGTHADAAQATGTTNNEYFQNEVVGAEGQSAPTGSFILLAHAIDFVTLIEFQPNPLVNQVVIGGPTTTQIIPGQDLLGNVGLWVNQPTGYAYQLMRNGAVFQAGPWGVGPSYTVQPSDVGSVITLQVIAMNSSGSGAPAASMIYLVARGQPLVTSQALGTQRNNYGDSVGCGFTVGSASVTVSALGRWVVSGSSGSHLLFIADATGATIATATIHTSGLSAGYHYINIDQGYTTLQGDSFYYLQSVEAISGDFWYDVNTIPTIDSHFVYAGAFSRSGGVLTLSNTTGIFGPVNLLFYPVTPPPLGTPIQYSWDFSP